MKEKPKWTRIVFIIGVFAFLLGTLDPLEGSVLILAGSFLLVLASWFNIDRHRKIFQILFILLWRIWRGCTIMVVEPIGDSLSFGMADDNYFINYTGIQKAETDGYH
jgi:hypothetical protein